MQTEKKCKECQEIKHVDLFYKQLKGMLGRTSECKECRKKRSMIYAESHREQKNEQSKLWYKTVDRSEYNAKWRKENPDYMKEYRRKKAATKIYQ